MFIEVYVLDAFKKTPIDTYDPIQTRRAYYKISIYDSSMNQLYSAVNRLENGIVTFTYKIKNDTKSGEFSVVAENPFNLPQVSKLFRIRDHPIEMIQIEADLPYESYRPGETVYGTFKA